MNVMTVMTVMNVPDAPKTSPDRGSSGALDRRTSRVKSSISPTIPEDRARLHNRLEDNSFVRSDLSGARFSSKRGRARQLNCYEVRWTEFTTPPVDRRLT